MCSMNNTRSGDWSYIWKDHVLQRRQTTLSYALTIEQKLLKNRNNKGDLRWIVDLANKNAILHFTIRQVCSFWFLYPLMWHFLNVYSPEEYIGEKPMGKLLSSLLQIRVWILQTTLRRLTRKKVKGNLKTNLRWSVTWSRQIRSFWASQTSFWPIISRSPSSVKDGIRAFCNSICTMSVKSNMPLKKTNPITERFSHESPKVKLNEKESISLLDFSSYFLCPRDRVHHKS